MTTQQQHKTMTMTEFRRDFYRLVVDERIVVTRYGKPFFAIIPPEDYELLLALKAAEPTP